jgi:hypothetical protein
MGRLSFLLLSLILMLSMGACNRTNDNAAAAGLHVTLLPVADGIQGDHLIVEIVDDDGLPVTGVTVSLEGNMTHAGMVPILTESVWDGADGDEDGIYRVPFRFTMLGDWIISTKIENRDGEYFTQDIDVTATNAAVIVK